MPKSGTEFIPDNSKCEKLEAGDKIVKKFEDEKNDGKSIGVTNKIGGVMHAYRVLNLRFPI